MIALIQTASDVKEILSIESVSVFGLMLLIIAYLAYQLEKVKNSAPDTKGIYEGQITDLKKEKEDLKKENDELDKMITQIIAEHKQDLREGSKDLVALVNKYHVFVEQLNSINSIRHGR